MKDVFFFKTLYLLYYIVKIIFFNEHVILKGIIRWKGGVWDGGIIKYKIVPVN